MLGGSHRTVQINSEPAGANVLINGTQRGTTPYTYTYVVEDGSTVRVDLRMAGRKDAGIDLVPKRNTAVLFADAMLLHIPYIVDHKSPALYRLQEEELTLVMYRESRSDLVRYSVPITDLELMATARTDLGTANGKVIRMGKDVLFQDLQWPEQLASNAASGFRDTWMEARATRMGTTKGDEAVQRAKLHLRPAITGISATIKGEKHRYSGPVTLDVDWRFYASDPGDSLLFSETRKVIFHALNEDPRNMIGSALAHAARLLADEPELNARIAGQFNSGIRLSKGSAVELQRPASLGITSRKEMITTVVKAVTTVQTEHGHGSGFLITNDGYIITNEHVVGREPLVKVKFAQGFTLDAQVVKVNKDFDLALLKVQATDLPALTIGDDAGLLLGEELYAIGTPLDTQLGQSVSRGILSGRRDLDGHAYLQADMSINPGNSGGPLVDENGSVVGVATMKISGKGLEGLGFAVPISVALDMLNITLR
jgi:hypothetical protein